MSIVTPPRAGVILGFVKVGGQDLPVTVSDEYLRWMAAFMQRIGGVKSIDLDELAALVVSPVPVHPPEPDAQAVINVDEVIQRAEDAARLQALAVLAEAEPVPDYAADIAALREGGSSMGLSIKRIVQDVISIGAGSLTGTYVIAGLTGQWELRHLGVSTDDTRVPGASVALTRSGNVITATRNLTGFISTVSFEYTEYNP